MKHKILSALILICIFIYILLTIKFSNGSIANLQVYSRVHIIPIVFWTFIILLCVVLLISDTGFIKIGAFLTLATSAFALVFQMVNVVSTFETVSSENYDLILETISSTDSDRIKVYKRDNIFFSSFIGSTTLANYYDVSYDIVGDLLIFTKCTENSCLTSEIDLE